MIGANRQERNFGVQTLANFGEAVEVGRVACVINGILAMSDDVTPESTMHVANDARTPVFRRRMGYGQAAMTVFLPPFQFDDLAETEVRNQIANVTGDNQDRGL